MDFHSVRKQPGRAMLLVLAGSSVLLVYLNQSHLSTPFRTDPAYPRTHTRTQQPDNPTPYAQRRIQDYQSPEYTAPGDTAPAPPATPQDPPPPSEVLVKFSLGKVEREKEEGEVKAQENVDTLVEKETSNVGELQTTLDDAEPQPEEEHTKEVEITVGTGGEGEKKEEAKGEDIGEKDGGVREDGNRTENLIDAILDQQRQILKREMTGYVFHPKLKVNRMEELVPEHGGRPVKSLVITTWRSGSTFIGDVLQSHPATYYHYEPLLDFGINQVRSGEEARQAIHNLRHLLTCNYSDMEHYLDYGPQHPWLFFHNTVLWRRCQQYPSLCWDPSFLSPFCSLFPFHSLKTVRLRLNLTRELLEDKTLGVQVLLLVRDPRGTMQSRHHREWCPGEPDCDDPARLCADLVSDYNTALQLRRKFPHSFRAVRYEDLSFDAYNMTRELFDFFHLNYHPRVQAFLDTHTKTKIGGVSSTFRNSKTAPIHWQKDLEWPEVEAIQKVCGKALKLWGYDVAKNEDHLRTFMPVGKFKFP